MGSQQSFSVPKRLGNRAGAFIGSNAGGIRIDIEVAPLRHTSDEDSVQNGIPASGRLAILCEPAYAVLAGFDRDRRNGARPCESMDRIDGVTAGERERAAAEDNEAKQHHSYSPRHDGFGFRCTRPR